MVQIDDGSKCSHKGELILHLVLILQFRWLREMGCFPKEQKNEYAPIKNECSARV